MTRLEEIRARCKAATPGPWEKKLFGTVAAADSGICIAACIGDANTATLNATLIAHAREDIPFLLDEAERLRQEKREAERQTVAQYDEVRRLMAEVGKLRKERDDLKARLHYVCQYANDVSNERIFDED